MAVTLVVEDGTNVPGANTYVSAESLIEYCESRDIALPAEESDVIKLILRSMDYLESFECEFQGARKFETQPLSFPRINLFINERPVEMPTQLVPILAQMSGALNLGFDPWAVTSNTDLVTEETVGPITTKFADPVALGNGTGMRLHAVETLMNPLFGVCGGFIMHSYRV